MPQHIRASHSSAAHPAQPFLLVEPPEHPQLPAGLSGGSHPTAEPPLSTLGWDQGLRLHLIREPDKSSPECPSVPLAFPEANEQSAGTGAANCKGNSDTPMSSFHSTERKIHTWVSCSILAFLPPEPSSIETAEIPLFVVLPWRSFCVFALSEDGGTRGWSWGSSGQREEGTEPLPGQGGSVFHSPRGGSSPGQGSEGLSVSGVGTATAQEGSGG